MSIKQNTADTQHTRSCLKISELGEEGEGAVKLLNDSYRSNTLFKRRLLVADAHTEQNRTFSELDAVTTKLIEHLPQ